MAREASHLYRLLALLDPLLGRAPLVIEPYHRPARRLQISYDESHSREQLPSFNGPVAARTDTLGRVVAVLEKAGVEFLNDERPGVRQRR